MVPVAPESPWGEAEPDGDDDGTATLPMRYIVPFCSVASSQNMRMNSPVSSCGRRVAQQVVCEDYAAINNTRPGSRGGLCVRGKFARTHTLVRQKLGIP